MTPLASYAAAIGGHRYELVVYSDAKGYLLRVYDGKACDLAAPVRLDPGAYGRDAAGEPWSRSVWRAWLREGAERLLFRMGLFRFHLAPCEPVTAVA